MIHGSPIQHLSTNSPQGHIAGNLEDHGKSSIGASTLTGPATSGSLTHKIYGPRMMPWKRYHVKSVSMLRLFQFR